MPAPTPVFFLKMALSCKKFKVLTVTVHPRPHTFTKAIFSVKIAHSPCSAHLKRSTSLSKLSPCLTSHLKTAGSSALRHIVFSFARSFVTYFLCDSTNSIIPHLLKRLQPPNAVPP